MIKLISDYDSFLVSAETHMMSDTEEVSANSPTDLENHLKDFKVGVQFSLFQKCLFKLFKSVFIMKF